MISNGYVHFPREHPLNEYLTGLRRPASSDRCDGLQMAG
jgi:hypothetical protein